MSLIFLCKIKAKRQLETENKKYWLQGNLKIIYKKKILQYFYENDIIYIIIHNQKELFSKFQSLKSFTLRISLEGQNNFISCYAKEPYIHKIFDLKWAIDIIP